MKYLVTAFVLVSLLLAGLLYLLFMLVGDDLPTPDRLEDVKPSVATQIVDYQGKPIIELYVEDRVPIRLSAVPPEFTDAIIAVEDRKFYSHWGIDPLGIIRAALKDLLRGSTAQGASTITQQLARNRFLHHRRTWKRKILEAILALRIERAFGKDEILELYINQIYFGSGAYGLQAAADRFYGSPAKDLDLDQLATLAGIVGNPAVFSPIKHPENCRRRRNHVLRAMYVTGRIDQSTYDETINKPIALGNTAPTLKHGAYFTEMVRQEVTKDYSGSGIYHDGLRIETTLDLDLQIAAETILETHLSEMERKNNYAYLRGNADSMLTRYGFAPESTMPAPLRLQGALVAIEPSTGAVRALVGGRDFRESQWNRAYQAPRQPASAFKPLIFAQAILAGYRTNDILLDTPVEYDIPGTTPEMSTWTPRNFEHTFHGPVTLRYTLMKSINVPTAKLLHALGVDPVIQLAKDLGIKTRLPRVLALATGSGELTLFELTAAYAVFANHGIRVDPYIVDRIFDDQGRRFSVHTPQSVQAIDERSSYIITHMLKSVIDQGTGRNARRVYGLTAPAAGKTGTNDDYTDAWFVGYTPELVVGVWVGFDLKIPIGGNATGTGAMAALPVWSQVMKFAENRYGNQDFPVPDGLTFTRTCLVSGLLATPHCTEPVDDVFVTGTEPLEYCQIHSGGQVPAEGDFQQLDRQTMPRDRWEDKR